MNEDRVAVTVDAVWPEDTDEEEAVVVDWFASKEDRIEEGATLCTIQVEKVDIDVPAPVAGVVDEIVVGEDEVCRPGETVAWIRAE
ncbi:MAG: biotin/lipoyl-containing protein [Halanaeroarchaeum sp.]